MLRLCYNYVKLHPEGYLSGVFVGGTAEHETEK